MTTPLNIYQRINEVRKKVSYVQKDKRIDGQNYLAVTHDAVTAMLRNHLIEQGIVVVPRMISSDVIEIGKTQKGAPVIRYAARYEIDFVNCDDPHDMVTVSGESHANDSGDKAPGKATSYATKYAMLKLFSIETGEDEEGRVEPYEPETITTEQAAKLEELLEESGANREAFLRWMRVPEVTAARAKDFDVAVKQLEKAKRKAKTNAAPAP